MIQRRQILALLALTLMWGINWPMMKLSQREITPLYFRALTMSCGALWLWVYYRARGLRMWPHWPDFAALVFVAAAIAAVLIPPRTLFKTL